MRKKIVAGNWKMNTTLQEAKILVSEVVNMIHDELRTDVEIILIPPFPFITEVKKLIDEKRIKVGAQNCSQFVKGAYTGEVSVNMLKSVDCNYVLVGHSERREFFNETSAVLKDKIDVTLQNDLIPIFCCGEPLNERENNTFQSFVCNQIEQSLFHLENELFQKIILAYEPIWAIGTGKTATSEQAQEMHKSIRNFVSQRYGSKIADDVTILYGGSCKQDNAKELFSCPDVDGGLIGGASLKSREFVNIVLSY